MVVSHPLSMRGNLGRLSSRFDYLSSLLYGHFSYNGNPNKSLLWSWFIIIMKVARGNVFLYLAFTQRYE